jgi:hypothetical protein
VASSQARSLGSIVNASLHQMKFSTSAHTPLSNAHTAVHIKQAQ